MGLPRSAVDAPAPDASGDVAGGELLEVLRARWAKVLEALNRLNPTLEAVLRTCDPIDVSEGVVTVGAPFPFHQGKLEEPPNRAAAEQVISQILGSPHQVRCTIVERRQRTSNKRPMPPSVG